MGRKSKFQNRWGRLGVTPNTRFTPTEKVALINRIIKRANKAAGYSKVKAPFVWRFTFLNNTGEVTAYTKGEARARIKEQIGVSKSKRLPLCVIIEKGERYVSEN